MTQSRIYPQIFGPGYGTQSAPVMSKKEKLLENILTLKVRATFLRSWANSIQHNMPPVSQVTHKPAKEKLKKIYEEADELDREITFRILESE